LLKKFEAYSTTAAPLLERLKTNNWF